VPGSDHAAVDCRRSCGDVWKQDRPATTSFSLLKDDWMTVSDLMHADCVQDLL
jgi:hypothetical protein